MKSHAHILITPRITEKGAYVSEKGVYVFNVAKAATKGEIARAIFETFKVMPRKVTPEMEIVDVNVTKMEAYLPKVLIGQSVMAEVKTVEHNLRWSDFMDHQPDALTEHADLGGLSLVVWVHSTGIYILRWPIPGFGKGNGLAFDTAAMLSVGGMTCGKS